MKGFKQIALLEGISLLILIFFAMPMKYIAHDPIYVKNIGMAHGILFVLYIIFAVLNNSQQKWTMKEFAVICIASLFPFGTFYIDKKYLQPKEA